METHRIFILEAEMQNDIAMDVDNVDSNQGENQDQEATVEPGPSDSSEDVHPLALVALNVYEVEDQGISEEAHIILDIEQNNQQRSRTISPVSSREPSPTVFDEDSTQSDTTNSKTFEKTTETHKSPTSKKRSFNENDANEDDGALCPICLDNWTTTGEHRICALKCGHLFGHKCVSRWLNSQTKKTCPTCKKRVGKGDIRYIYAKRLTAVDTAELESIKEQLEVVIQERNKAQNDLAKSACREQLLKREIDYLKTQYSKIAWKAVGNSGPTEDVVRLYMDKSVPVCKFGESRVFDASCPLDLLVASMKSPTNLFCGYGLKKINISTYKSLAFLPVHQAQIRDITFHPMKNLILTASMDKFFKVIDNDNNTIVHQFNHQMPLWSCCWDQDKDSILYIGTQSGSVLKYDLRHLTGPVSTLAIEGDMSPVVSIAAIPSYTGELCDGGVVSCKLNSLWLFQECNGNVLKHPLSLEGPFISMKYHLNSKQLLVSSRPNSRIAYSRHTLCTLQKNNQERLDCNIIHSFQGGGMQKLLSKSCFVEDSREYVAAHQENSKSVVLWSVNTGEKVYSLPAHATVLDLKGIQNQYGNYIVSLTERQLEFFKFA